MNAIARKLEFILHEFWHMNVQARQRQVKSLPLSNSFLLQYLPSVFNVLQQQDVCFAAFGELYRSYTKTALFE